MASRALAAALFGLVVAFVWCIVFVVGYAVANLYLTGHGMKPGWFDSASNVLLVVSNLVVWLVVSVLTWRSGRSRGAHT